MENLELLLEQANNGDAMSQYKLGRAYESGDGVEKDLTTARMWYQKSADNGYKNAEVKLRLLSVQQESVNTQTEVTRQIYIAPPVPHSFIVGNAQDNISNAQDNISNEQDNISNEQDNISNAQDNISNEQDNISNEQQLQKSSQMQSVKGRKSKVIAALLAFFGGCFGAHDFYLGHIVQGIIKIFLTITCIGFYVTYIWALIDFVRILCNGKLDSNGQLLK